MTQRFHWPLAALCAVLALTLWHLHDQRDVGAQSPVPANAPGSVASVASAAPAVSVEIRGASVFVDSLRPAGPPSADPYASCGIPVPAEGSKSPWEDWISLAGDRLEARSSAEALPVFACRIPNGVAVCVANHSASKAAFRLGVRLGRGVYTADRLSYALGQPAPRLALEELSSRILGGTGTATKPGWLGPNSVTIYRFMNRNAETAWAYRRLAARLREVRTTNPAEWRLLMPPLRECDANIGSLASGILPGRRYDKLNHIHRALLTIAHAEALCANFRSLGRMNASSQAALAQDLAGVEEALTELSVGCLNLVPHVSVEIPDPGRPSLRRVTVSVTNLGSRSVSLVRLGATAPAGGRIWPQDNAMFSTLGPGETVHATFTVQLAEEEEVATARGVTADISYFTSRAPARLHLGAI